MNRFIQLAWLVALLASPAALYFVGQRYRTNKYFLYLEWSVHTSSTHLAGTDSRITFTFGYINETSNQLVWFTERMTPKNGYGHFEKGSVDKYHEIRKDDDYIKAEEFCDRDALAFDQYKACLIQPNVVFIELEYAADKWIDVDSGWKLDKIELTTSLQFWRKGAWASREKDTSVFRTGDWALGKGGYYIKRSKNGENQALAAGWPVIGRSYS